MVMVMQMSSWERPIKVKGRMMKEQPVYILDRKPALKPVMIIMMKGIKMMRNLVSRWELPVT